jgi:hypothetical protein
VYAEQERARFMGIDRDGAARPDPSQRNRFARCAPPGAHLNIIDHHFPGADQLKEHMQGILGIEGLETEMVFWAETGELSYLVGEKTIEQLPLNGRNYTDLALLQPGVVAFSHRLGDLGPVDRYTTILQMTFRITQQPFTGPRDPEA